MTTRDRTPARGSPPLASPRPGRPSGAGRELGGAMVALASLLWREDSSFDAPQI
jgi:hypothetical protein